VFCAVQEVMGRRSRLLSCWDPASPKARHYVDKEIGFCVKNYGKDF